MAAASAASTHQPRRLVSLWFLLSSFLVIWDTGYIFLRPRSMKGGDLHWIWAPYSLYMDIDYIYGLPSWNTHDGFPAAQSFMNIIETLLNFVYLFLVHIQNSPQSIAVAPVVGLIAAIMTLSKTVLYWLNVSTTPSFHAAQTTNLDLAQSCRTTFAAGARRVTTTGATLSISGSSPTAPGSSFPPLFPSFSQSRSPRISRPLLVSKVRQNRHAMVMRRA